MSNKLWSEANHIENCLEDLRIHHAEILRCIDDDAMTVSMGQSIMREELKKAETCIKIALNKLEELNTRIEHEATEPPKTETKA